MVLENLLSELIKLNNHLDRNALPTTSFPLSTELVNTPSEDGKPTVDPIKHAGKRTYLQHEDGGVLIVGKGEPMPEGGYQRITKSEYTAAITISGAQGFPADDISENEGQGNLDLGSAPKAPERSEDDCRTVLRELRGKLIESGLPDDEANKKIFSILKKFSAKGSMPDVSPSQYNGLYDWVMDELVAVDADGNQ